ncbi:radical s-adenosyl methionine domain-containing protein [Anaeramoeba flamelloides]|uniref:Radical s-adenosyl methionine domain-containing protein n=1 Tax=Anaeramoeba flamelloides TaxID=1746091 RepID=A0AAV7ZKL5_9EUKA|nr:radical s-adenosyl methionine domain-containing protein [Anaeramoeba flamelloides]
MNKVTKISPETLMRNSKYLNPKMTLKVITQKQAKTTTAKQGLIAESINCHLTNLCNYQCKFCFGRYEKMSNVLTKEGWKKIIDELSECGVKKINFAGGEPTLLQYLPELITYSREQGFYVSLISNGTGINKQFLDKGGKDCHLIGLSVDSKFAEIENLLGRCLSRRKTTNKNKKSNNKYSHVKMIQEVASLIHKYNVDLKLNTTVTNVNWWEDMNNFIGELNPSRWKVFQVHPIDGINNNFFKMFGELSNKHFYHFINKHKGLNPVVETSEMMNQSYCMITPDGRFYQSSGNRYEYSKPILNVGLKNAFDQVTYSLEKFKQRNGDFYEKN